MARRSDSDSAPRRAGPYELERELGSGGMGVVYLARRVDGAFEQRVAVKLIRRGLDSEEILLRFERERQLLANLDHPGIARFVDGGLTAEGRPYFALEYVEGEPIDRWVEERALSVSARLELFRQVCAAVQHAHRNLVVHRDLSPRNILVTAEGRAKLLDFGIAKVLGPCAAEHELTGTTSWALTPAYASPEQVRGEPVTTASDVYSLGVILYRLLSGRLPYDIASDSPAAIERAVCEAPPRPLGGRLAGELETIVFAALSKDPARRYASAVELSDDIARYLSNRPVRARPDTWSYRARKFTRRHRVAVGAAAAALVVLLVGLSVSVAQYRAADAARDTLTEKLALDLERLGTLAALNEEVTRARLLEDERSELAGSRAAALRASTRALADETARVEARRAQAERAAEVLRAANEELERERALAGARFGSVWKLANALVLDVHGDLLRVPGSTRVRELVLGHGLRFLDGLAEDAEGDERLQRDLVAGYLRLASVQGASSQASLGRSGDALASVERALAIAEALPLDPGPAQAPNRYTLGSALLLKGNLLLQAGASGRATEHYERALEVCAGFARAEPPVPGHDLLLALTLSNLGNGLMSARQLDEAGACFEEACALLERSPGGARQPALAELWLDRAHLAAMRDGPEAAIEPLERALNVLARGAADLEPADRRAGVERRVLLRLAQSYADTGRLDEAAAILAEVAQGALERSEAEPENVEASRRFVHASNHVGELLARAADWGALLDHAESGLPIAERLATLDPDNAFFQLDLGTNLVQLARAELEAQLYADAERHGTRAVEIGERLSRADPGYLRARLLEYSARALRGQRHFRRAELEEVTTDGRVREYRAAAASFRSSLETLADMRGRGIPHPADAWAVESLTKALEQAEERLASLEEGADDD